MYDVIYIDAHGSETPVAQHLDDRTDAADVARRAAADRGVGRMFLPGSTKLPNCVCVVPVTASAEPRSTRRVRRAAAAPPAASVLAPCESAWWVED